ncbi:hypothetical protein GE061_015513 [Apolygus lucorum]|uniref:Odorant receptor n=1 Tax=Apolygus lucorum TaxID=248454 RepID=A0A8S9XLC0_APOLU|nr:hypothetical protein GE061_015513 [Apolygus lucorum]
MYSTFLLRNDFEIGSGVLNYGLLMIVAIGILMNMQYFRHEVLHISRIMCTGLFRYSDKTMETEDMIKFRKHMKFQRQLLIALAVYVATIGGIVVLGPIIDEKLGMGFDGTFDENGVNRRLPVPLNYPGIDTSKIFGFLLALGMIFQSGVETTLIYGGATLLFATACQFILTEMKTLSVSIQTIPHRAAKKYCRIHNVSKKSLDLKTIFDDSEFQDCITDCLKENIQHYLEIYKFTKVLETYVKVPLLLAVLVITLAIGLTMMKLNEDIVRIGATISFTSVALGELCIMFLIAVYGEYYLTMSQEVNWEIYFTPWYKFSVKNQKLIRQFLISTRNELCIFAWIVRMDMEMFASVMNSAYSFFNFLNISKTLEEDELN